MRSGIKLLADTPGDGPQIQRQHVYLVRLKLWLNKGDPVRWETPWGLVDRARLEDDGETLISDLRVDRENLFSGLFYGVEGMRIGGTRKLKVSPHLAYGEQGVPGLIPADAVIIAEISFLEERAFSNSVDDALANRKHGPGRNPTPNELREAERVAALHPEQQKNHPSAVAADHTRLDHINTYGSLPEYYIDQPFACRICGKREIWTAAAQKWYYEEAKGHIDAFAVKCHDCRKNKKHGGTNEDA